MVIDYLRCNRPDDFHIEDKHNKHLFEEELKHWKLEKMTLEKQRALGA